MGIVLSDLIVIEREIGQTVCSLVGFFPTITGIPTAKCFLSVAINGRDRQEM